MARLDPYDPQCPTRALLERIADKWTVLIVGYLKDGTKRHAAIRRGVGGISQKVLTQALRRMERDGLVVRRSYPTVPPQVEYTLTPAGLSLVDLVERVHAWAVDNTAVVLRAQQKFDAVEEPQRTELPEPKVPST